MTAFGGEGFDRRRGCKHYGSRPALWSALFAVAAAGGLFMPASPAQAQGQFIQCINPGQPLLRIPEIVSNGGKLRGVLTLSAEADRMNLGKTGNQCVPQYIRAYRAPHGTLPGYAGSIPAGYPGATPPAPASQYADPMPGPTLRAKVGDLIELTFLNQIDTGVFGDSIDRAERGRGCDESSAPYPGADKFPDCFHGSSTGNIHFHGTHTNPQTTGDNVFIEIRPSPRKNDKPTVTEATVKKQFDAFFKSCEEALSKGPLVQFPYSWNDLPKPWVAQQVALLRQYDSDPANMEKLLPVDLQQLKEGAWPQYYIGAYPYCYRLPAYTESSWPPAAPMVPASHAAMPGMGKMPGMEMPPPQERPLVMGQSPGTHWYHAHKHGSTTINVSNAMTGVFIIEGKYDEDLDKYYGAGWTRKQPILEINELGVSPNLYTGTRGPLPFQVNGRPLPTVSMKSGEVQMFRIANSASRSGAYFVAPTQGLEWKQIAQDGVQFSPENYWNNLNQPFLMSAGNRVDLLVKAPVNSGSTPLSIPVQVNQSVNDSENITGTPGTLFTIVVQPGAAVTGNAGTFVPQAQAPTLPPFLADIKPEEVTGTKKVVFESVAPMPKPTGVKAPFTQHLIDGKKFDGNIGEVVLLNKVEEWTIVNRTTSASPPGPINHPFHIHINPFQIVEVFDPLAPYIDPATHKPVLIPAPVPDPNKVGVTYVPRYIISTTSPATTANPFKQGSTRELANGKCWVNPSDESTWRPCGTSNGSGAIWWDVFGIPSGAVATVNGQQVIIPGYFKMRSRFVDYTGQYVIHCHILAHEDRGMMTVVEVVPFKTPYSHH